MKRKIVASSNNKHVAQLSIDIIHEGDYSIDDAVRALEKAGFCVAGADSYDITDQYRPQDIERLSKW